MKSKTFNMIFKLGVLAGRYLRLVFKKFYTVKYFFYSGWSAAQFKKVGSNFSIISPAHIVGGNNVSIGDNFSAGPRFRIETYTVYKNQTFNPLITIGNNVTFSWDCHIGCIEKLVIGNNVLFASRIYISDHFHGDTNLESLRLSPLQRELKTKGPVIIGDDVWIGEGVCVLPGVKIGKGAIVGANAVVTKDIPEYSIAAGVPAKIMGKLLNHS